MRETKYPIASEQRITSFLPIFQKKLERLERLGLDDTAEANDLRRALKVTGKCDANSSTSPAY